MKKFVLVFALLFSNFAFADAYVTKVSGCDESNMRAALDDATVEHRAVITIVECEETDEGPLLIAVPKQNRPGNSLYINAYRPCESRAKPVAAVVHREYFVRETVQEYKPVIKYVPSHRYVRVRPVCNECDM